MRTYPHGVTCWIDTDQPDPDAAGRFYAALFGWTLTADQARPGRTLATVRGLPVAGIGRAAKGTANGTAAWHTYVAVDDLRATEAAVVAHGGTVTGPGRCIDPAGAGFRLWQTGPQPAAQLTNEPGTWNFSDLHTPDPATVATFYTPLFGWRTKDADGFGMMIQVPGYGEHLASTVDPGIYERQATVPAGFADAIGWLAPNGEHPASEDPAGGDAAGGGATGAGPAVWHVTFAVADRDACVETAERLGATVLSAAEDAWTRNAVIRDPQGAELTISQFAPSSG